MAILVVVKKFVSFSVSRITFLVGCIFSCGLLLADAVITSFQFKAFEILELEVSEIALNVGEIGRILVESFNAVGEVVAAFVVDFAVDSKAGNVLEVKFVSLNIVMFVAKDATGVADIANEVIGRVVVSIS